MCRLSIYSLLAVGIILGLTACSKDKKADQEKAETVINDFMMAKTSFERAYTVMDESAQQEDGLNGFTGPDIASNRNCGTVEFSVDQSQFFPAVLSIDYGDGCTLEDQRLSGKLSATFNGFLFEKDKSIELSFDLFAINDISVDGRYTLTNKGFDDKQQQIWEHEIQDGQLKGPHGFSIEYAANTSTTQIAGQDTHWWNAGIDGLTDDVWEVIQSATYINPFGDVFTVSTAIPIIKNVLCEWPISGAVIISGESLPHHVEVNFGENTCDNIATVAYGTVEFEIEL